MDELEDELKETIIQIENLGLFSLSNINLLQKVFERYDAVIEQLFNQDKIIYHQSIINISVLEPQLSSLFSGAIRRTTKREIYNKSKISLNFSANEDLYNYQLFLNRKRLSKPE